jgi:hypothetical protein
MKDLHIINQFLLPSHYRRYGWYLLIAGVPTVLVLFTLLIFNWSSEAFRTYWNEWGGYLLHIPLSLGLFWTLFASEKDEDEMYQALRLKATFHGIRFIFLAMLLLPGISLARHWFTDSALQTPDVGGNLAVVTLLLLYANVAYWWMKKKEASDEE